jgi:hypothetical protein
MEAAPEPRQPTTKGFDCRLWPLIDRTYCVGIRSHGALSTIENTARAIDSRCWQAYRHGREDLLMHHGQCGTRALAALAESAGVLKELKDAQGGSGFSFVDLSADLAGIEFARFSRSTRSIEPFAKQIKVADFAACRRARRGITPAALFRVCRRPTTAKTA